MRQVSAGEFKAKCLAILEEVRSSRSGIVITKRGKAIARLVPVSEEAASSLEGSILEEGDIVSPLHDVWKRR